MSRSFDISRKPKPRPAPAAPAAPIASAPSRRGRKKSGFIFFVFAIGVIALGFSFNRIIKQPSVKPAHTVKPTQKTTKNSSITSSIKSQDKSDATKTTTPDTTKTTTPAQTSTDTSKTGLKIQILNGTGIETVTDQVKKLLETNSLAIDSSSKAQFEYSQTYVYYRPNAVDTAKKISEILKDYKPTLSESQISGLFDILIIIGKQNLPAAQ